LARQLIGKTTSEENLKATGWPKTGFKWKSFRHGRRVGLVVSDLLFKSQRPIKKSLLTPMLPVTNWSINRGHYAP